MKKYFSAIVSVIAVVSCSLKEDRIECPCVFTLDLTACAIEDDFLTFTLWDSDEEIMSDLYFRRDVGKKYEYDLARKEYVASAYTGDKNQYKVGRHLLVRRGSQADSLFAWSSILYANAETVEARVRLYKQFATFTFDMSEFEADNIPYRVRIVSGFGGIDIQTLSPVENDFEYEFILDGSNSYPVRIPRQGDDGMAIDIFRESKNVGHIPLGENLRNAGYDWSAKDLQDVIYEVSGNEVEVSVDISDWDDDESEWKF